MIIVHAGASVEINVNLLHKNMFSTLFIGVFSSLIHHTLLSENVFHIFTQHIEVACWVKVENTPNIKVEYLPTRPKVLSQSAPACSITLYPLLWFIQYVSGRPVNTKLHEKRHLIAHKCGWSVNAKVKTDVENIVLC